MKYRIFALLIIYLFLNSCFNEVWTQAPLLDTIVRASADSIDLNHDIPVSGKLDLLQIDSTSLSEEMPQASISDVGIAKRVSDSRFNLSQLEEQINKKLSILNREELLHSATSINQTNKIELSSSLEEVNRLTGALSALRDDKTLNSELEYIEESIVMLEGSMAQLKIEYPEEDLTDYTFELLQKEPNSYDCHLNSDSTDMNQITYSTQVAPLFSYTHPKLKPHFIGKDYMSCTAQIVESNSNYFILLSVEIKSNRAKETFGGLEKGEIMRLELMNGEKIITYNMRRSFGEYSSETNTTSYTPVYSIKKNNLKKVSKVELDKIGLMWTTGYEDYEVYELDFFMNHGNCILK